jgi:Tfp pilus assembly protein PilF
MLELMAENYSAALEDLIKAAEDEDQTAANLDLALAKAYFETGQTDLADMYRRSALEKAEAGEPLDEALRRSVENRF